MKKDEDSRSEDILRNNLHIGYSINDMDVILELTSIEKIVEPFLEIWDNKNLIL